MGCRKRPKRHLGTPPTAQKRQKRSLRGGCNPFLRAWYPIKADSVLPFYAYFEHFSLRLSGLDDPRHFFHKGIAVPRILSLVVARKAFFTYMLAL